jgi:predicted small lipoprotein YifL
MRINAVLAAALAAILLMGASACGLRGDLYLTESAKPFETPAAEPEINGDRPDEQGTIGPAATEQPGPGGVAQSADSLASEESTKTLAEEDAQAGLNEAGPEPQTGDEDEPPKASAPAP